MLALIAAISNNNCIGKNGKLPWHIPEDLAYFKKITQGKVIIMGRRTWESIPVDFRPLSHRTNVVLTSQKEYAVPRGVEVYQTLADALDAHRNEDMMIIGGATIYNQTIDKADTLYITYIHETVYGDAFFPTIDPTLWRETERDDRDGFSFVVYRRIDANSKTDKRGTWKNVDPVKWQRAIRAEDEKRLTSLHKLMDKKN